jgi:5-methylcytosine-specific restriction endonuclease McrA
VSQHHKRMSGRKRQQRNARILAASDVCHICGHPGSDAVDHVVALARGGIDADPNLKPAHHDVACPTCGIKCNRVKADKAWAPIVKRSGSLARPQGTTPTAPTPGHFSA